MNICGVALTRFVSPKPNLAASMFRISNISLTSLQLEVNNVSDILKVSLNKFGNKGLLSAHLSRLVSA
jgi:hypothetical protein